VTNTLHPRFCMWVPARKWTYEHSSDALAQPTCPVRCIMRFNTVRLVSYSTSGDDHSVLDVNWTFSSLPR
jgi:hypothetical protein